MPFESILKDAVKTTIGAVLTAEIQEIVAKETRRAIREHEDRFTAVVRAAVSTAIAEMLE